VLAAGTQRTFIATVGEGRSAFSVDILGLTMDTNATFTWTFPDGRVFPPPGEPSIIGTNSGGRLRLCGQAGGWWQANISEMFIPPGQHILTVKAIGPSYLVLSVN